MTMSIEGLDDSRLKALDYILNYQPDTRIKYTLDEDLVDDLVDEGLVEKTEKKDDYSNYYEVLKVKDEYKDAAERAIETNFEDLYPGFSKERIREIFQDEIGGMFALFNNARSNNNEYVRSTYRIPESLLDELAEAGFGFRREYLTTTDNLKEQLVFRTSPRDGQEKLLDFADSVIRSHLEGLNQIEKWAIYVKSAAGSGYITSNPADFSPDRLEKIKDNPSVEEASDEDLEFIKEDIKDYLRSKIYEFLEEDSFYFSVLEYLNIRSDQSGKINSEFLDDIGYDKRDSVENCLPQLVQEGILLRQGDDTFVLTDQIKEILEVIEKRTVMVSYPIRTREEGQEILYEIMEDAEEEIKIIDQFFDENALELIKTVVPKKEELDVHILTAVKDKPDDKQRTKLSNSYEGLVDQSRFEIRVIQDEEETPHDRFIIVDGEKIWQVGHSINGLGKNFSTIFLHSEEESNHYQNLFDSLWEEGDLLPESSE